MKLHPKVVRNDADRGASIFATVPIFLPVVAMIGIATPSAAPEEVSRWIGELGSKPRFGKCGVGNMGIRRDSKALQATYRLVDIGPAAVEPLIKVVGTPAEWMDPQDPHAEKRVLAVEALGRIGDPRAIRAVGAVLRHHPGVQERVSAACALADLRANEYVEEVVAMFSDDRPVPSFPRLSAGDYVSAMMRPYGTIAHAAVVKALRDPSEKVRYRAMRAAHILSIPAPSGSVQ